MTFIKKILISVAAITGGLMMSSCIAETRFGGKTVQEAFSDERVAAIITATSNGDFAEADRWRKSGADVNAIGGDGVSPLIWIMSTTLGTSKIEYLLKAGADPNYRDERRKGSAMYFAAGGNRPDILELMLKYKGNPNLIGPRDRTMLMVAASQFRDANIDLLLKYGADINQIDHLDETVADKCVSYGRYDLVARFLDLGLKQNFQELAKGVEIRVISPNSEQQRWKEKVIEMLKARGAVFPAIAPKRNDAHGN
jgi:uncharacterized protein